MSMHCVFMIKTYFISSVDWKRRSEMDLKNKCRCDRRRSVKVEQWSWVLKSFMALTERTVFFCLSAVSSLPEFSLISRIQACAKCCHGNPEWTVRSCYIISWQLIAALLAVPTVLLAARVSVCLLVCFFLCFPVLLFLMSASFHCFTDDSQFIYSIFSKSLFLFNFIQLLEMFVSLLLVFRNPRTASGVLNIWLVRLF